MYHRIQQLYYRLRYRNSEWFPTVSPDGNIIGKAPRDVCHNGSCILHPVVHLHLFNSGGELFLQKRSAHKEIQPGKWDTSVGGHIGIGETPQTALMREAGEEIGITGFTPVFLYSYLWRSSVEHELIYSYMTTYDGEINIDNVEVADGRFFSIDTVLEMLDTATLTPNFESEFELLKEKEIGIRHAAR